jgi:hypothetical protein
MRSTTSSHAEVLAPQALRERIAAETAALYASLKTSPSWPGELELVQEPRAPLSVRRRAKVARGSSPSLAGLGLTVSPNIAGLAGHEDSWRPVGDTTRALG